MIIIYILGSIFYYILSLHVVLKFFISGKYYKINNNFISFCRKNTIKTVDNIFFQKYFIYDSIEKIIIDSVKNYTEEKIKLNIVEIYKIKYLELYPSRNTLGLYSIIFPLILLLCFIVYLLIVLPSYVIFQTFKNVQNLQNKIINLYFESVKKENTEDLLIPVYPKNDITTSNK